MDAVNRKKMKAQAEMHDGDDRSGVMALEEHEIRDWALADGGLPGPSARAFASWINTVFFDWNEDGELTNEQVLKGARANWVGEA